MISIKCSHCNNSIKDLGGASFEAPPQSVKKVEVQEALPPAGVIGAAPLTLVPQHFPPQTSVALFAGNSDQFRVFRQAGAELLSKLRLFYAPKQERT